MLPQQHRLRRPSDFQSVYRSGKAYRSSLFRVHVMTRQGRATRFGIVVPNKLLKQATARNRKKRQIRAAIQHLLPAVRPGHDVVVSPQAPAVQASYGTLCEDLSTLFRQARLL